jgi:hypothetical protein
MSPRACCAGELAHDRGGRRDRGSPYDVTPLQRHGARGHRKARPDASSGGGSGSASVGGTASATKRCRAAPASVRPRTGGQHAVARPPPTQRRRLCQQQHIVESDEQCREHRPDDVERHHVGDVEQQQAVRSQRPAHQRHAVDREGRRHCARAVVEVPDEQVDTAGAGCGELVGGVGDDDRRALDRAEWRDRGEHVGSRFDDDLSRARSGCGQPSRHRHRTAAEVQGAQPFRPRMHRVDDDRHVLHVLELQMGRVLDVDVGLFDTVDEQDPSGRTVEIAQQLDRSADPPEL